MTPAETCRVIELAGGDSAFAKLLGLDGRAGFQQRVNNWKRRGIPASVVLDHYGAIQRLRESKPQKGAA